jgi:hypothetical protein
MHSCNRYIPLFGLLPGPHSCNVGLLITLPLPVDVVLALGVKLIGLRPFLSGVAFTVDTTGVGVVVAAPVPAPVPRKLATLLPKKLPIPLPIPPNVARISATGGLGNPEIPDVVEEGEVTRDGDRLSP